MRKKVYVQSAQPGSREAAISGVEALFAMLPPEALPKPGMHVLLKPNLLSKHAPGAAVTTHPDVLEGVILALQKRGVNEITVADSPGGPYTKAGLSSLYKTCGLTAVCEETGAELYTDFESGERAVNGALVKRFTLLKPVLNCDYLLNLPKFKTHVLTGLSGAVKNLFGCVPGMAKAEFHMRFSEREHFGQMLVDLCECVKPNLTLVDGLLGMEGDGPAGGEAREVGLLLAGTDPYSLDLAICRYMGLPPSRVPTLSAAAKNGLAAESFDESLLLGSEAAKEPVPNFKAPRSYTGRVDFSNQLPAFLQPLMVWGVNLVSPRPVVNKKKCIGCGKCAEACPAKVISLENSKAHIHKKNCIRCFCCHEMCPVKAIDLRRVPLFRL